MKVASRNLLPPCIAALAVFALASLEMAPWVQGILVFLGVAGGFFLRQQREGAQLAEALEESEARMRTLIEGMDVILWEFDPGTMCFTYVSPQAERLGYPLEAWLEPDFWISVIHPLDREDTVACCELAVSQEQDHRMQYRMLQADGGMLWVEDVVRCSKDADGRLKLRGVFVDISNLKNAESSQWEAAEKVARERERLELTLEAGELGMWEWRLDEQLVLLDWRFATSLESPFSGERIAQEEWLDFIHPEDLPNLQELLAPTLRGETELYEATFRLTVKNGERRWLHARGKIVEHDEQGQPLRMVGTHTDVTEAKHRELELERLKVSADEANRAKSAFLANMSHEIRTPLTAILGYADMLIADDARDLSPEQSAQMLETIRTAGQHLLSVINDILDLSKIEAGAMSVEHVPTNLPSILTDIEAVMMPRARVKGVELAVVMESEVPTSLYSDPTRLRQILINLVGNATKFTQQGAILVRVKVVAEEGPRLCIEVEDTGPGMTEVETRALFRPFSQVDASVTRRFGGTGLGLSICRRLTHLLGGDVQLAWTEEGHGSCFVLDVPLEAVDGAVWIRDLSEARARQEGPECEDQSPLSGRVLLVEDGAVNRRLISALLTKAGLEVDLACDGLEGLARIEEEGDCYELVLTDIQMPELDGTGMTRRLRAQGYDRPVIALTAHAMAEDRARCMDAGCNDYITKPVDRATLIAACRRWISLRVPTTSGS